MVGKSWLVKGDQLGGGLKERDCNGCPIKGSKGWLVRETIIAAGGASLDCISILAREEKFLLLKGG